MAGWITERNKRQDVEVLFSTEVAHLSKIYLFIRVNNVLWSILSLVALAICLVVVLLNQWRGRQKVPICQSNNEQAWNTELLQCLICVKNYFQNVRRILQHFSCTQAEPSPRYLPLCLLLTNILHLLQKSRHFSAPSISPSTVRW